MKKRVTRAISQEQTKHKLLASAEREFAFVGYEGAAVDTICAKAGFSRGAFYSNFKSKEDLFLQLISLKMDGVLNELAMSTAAPNPREFMGEYYSRRAKDPLFTMLMAEFLTVGIRNRRLKKPIAALNKRYIDAIASGIKPAAQAGKDLVLRQQIAAALVSAAQGIMLFHFGNDEEFDETFVVSSLQYLLANLLSP